MADNPCRHKWSGVKRYRIRDYRIVAVFGQCPKCNARRLERETFYFGKDTVRIWWCTFDRMRKPAPLNIHHREEK